MPPEGDASSSDAGDVRQLRAMMALFQRGPAPNPLAKHLTSGHVDRALDITEKGMDAMERDRNESRRYGKFIAVLAAVSSLALVGLLVLTGNAELVERILPIFGGGFIGFVGGYGYGKSRS